MSDVIFCPNCDSRMNEGDPCPECSHHDGDSGCECAYCVGQQVKELEWTREVLLANQAAIEAHCGSAAITAVFEALHKVVAEVNAKD